MPRSAPTETAAEIVLDASVAVRALADQDEVALAWLRRIDWVEVVASWPDLAYIEVANSLQTFVNVRRWSRDQARGAMERLVLLPIDSRPSGQLATAALELALERNLTPYDACYALLAEARGATLVTADRRLAAAVRGSVLV